MSEIFFFYLQSFLSKSLYSLLLLMSFQNPGRLKWTYLKFTIRFVSKHLMYSVQLLYIVPPQKKTLKLSSFNFQLCDCPDMLPLSISFIRCGYPLWDGNSKCDIPQFPVGLVWEKRNSVWKHCMNIWARPRWLVPRSPFSNYCSAGTPAMGTQKQKTTHAR